MNTYSQNKEDLFVLDYFNGYVGNLLEIGSNNGIDLSNSKLLIDNNWSAVLVEPGETYKDLHKLHLKNKNVRTFNLGIGDKTGDADFYESEAHVPNGEDRGLVSTVNFEETKRWPDVKFKKTSIYIKSWTDFYHDLCERYNKQVRFDFISIDAEGFDEIILKQMDLDDIGCKVLCIEWNSDRALLQRFVEHCKGYRMGIGLINAENIIFIKP